MSHTTKQLLLAKLGFIAKKNQKKQIAVKLEKNPEFVALLKDIRTNFDSKDYTASARQSVLMSLTNLKVKDPVILSKTAELLKAKQFKNIGMITNLLYSMAKLHYKHSDDAWIAASIDIILSEPVIDRVTACRNLWNLQALDYRSDVAIKRFCETIVASDGATLGEIDIANALCSLAHFQNVHYDCIVKLIEQSIRRAQDFKLQTLAVIVNSLADLDVANPTLLEIVKQILLRKIDTQGPN